VCLLFISDNRDYNNITDDTAQNIIYIGNHHDNCVFAGARARRSFELAAGHRLRRPAVQ